MLVITSVFWLTMAVNLVCCGIGHDLPSGFGCVDSLLHCCTVCRGLYCYIEYWNNIDSYSFIGVFFIPPLLPHSKSVLLIHFSDIA